MSPTPIELRAGELRLALRPDLGGSIAGLWLGGPQGEQPVLRSTEAVELGASRLSGCYPLAPYSNRLGYRRFRWLGQDHTTAPNFDDNPHSVHGVAWQRPWQVLGTHGHEAELRYEHAADEHWPFAFELRQRYVRGAARLRDEKMSLRLTSSLPYLVVYTPATKPYYCVEPVSHVSNALHMAEPTAHGLRSLASQATFDAWMKIEVDHA